MFETFLNCLDYFLPNQFPEIDTQVKNKGRVIVATTLMSFLATVFAWIICFAFNFPFVVHLGIFFCIATFVGQLYYLKKDVFNFKKKLLVSASIQLIVITTLVYLTSFSEKGMGFFSLIWLIPLILMSAFYFDTRSSLYFAFSHFVVFAGVCILKYSDFMRPVYHLPYFSITFLLFLFIVMILCFSLAFLFVHLKEELQREVLKQRDLLYESAKFQSLGQMTSNLAHDVNNPLITIQGKLHQIRNLLSKDQLDLDQCDKIVETVEATLINLSQMVRGISTFAREGRGDQMVSISVSELIKNNLAFSMNRISHFDISITLDIDSRLTLICYPSFISQVLLNLLNNAIDAITLYALENPKEIKISAYLQRDWVYILISDTGAGVPKEIEHKIFDSFFTTKSIGKGTGLGLSISKGLVEVHEGELSYRRQDLKSIFEIKLPSYE